MGRTSRSLAALAWALAIAGTGCDTPTDQKTIAATSSAEIDSLKTRITALENQLASLRSDLDASRQREQSLKDALAPLEAQLAQSFEQSPPPATAQDAREQPTVSPRTESSGQGNATTCDIRNTGDFGFVNSKTQTVFTVVLYYREGSDQNRTILVRPGQTQYLYDFPSGPHNYLVTYKGQVPFMSFPPGAPTIEKDITYMQGQVNVERCKSLTLDIK